jgi:hypothetical protein
VAAWIAFYVAAEFNPSIGGATRVIPAVPMLALLAWQLTSAVRRPNAQTIAAPIAPRQLLAAA